jgi:hypothetical protein
MDHPQKQERAAMSINLKIVLFALGSMATTLCHAETLGRLFFTPQQRTQLEYAELEGGNSGSNVSAVIVNGIVQRHGGKRTVWINGVPRETGYSDEHAPASTQVTVPGKQEPVRVKVGQKVLIQPAPDGEK